MKKETANRTTLPPAPSPNHKTEDAAKFLNVKPAEAFREERIFSSTTEAQAGGR